ncbi:MAG: hypothetical protein V4510_04920 [bacterium]
MDFGQWVGGNSEPLGKLGLYAGGIAVYTLLVTLLYVPMGHRLMLGRKVGDDRVVTSGRRTLYLLLFPLISFAFFLVIAGALALLAPFAGSSNSGQQLTPDEILPISMAIVIAIRIVAYFHEDAAQELGKIMPLGLLGVVLVANPQFNTVKDAFQALQQVFARIDLVAAFFFIVVVVEFLLRGIYAVIAGPGERRARAKNAAKRSANPGAPPPRTK